MQSGLQRVGERSVQATPEPSSPRDIEDDDAVTISRSSSVEPGPSSLPGLNALAEFGPNERPPYSTFTLVKYAILGSPNQKLTLAEIYDAIADRFPWYQTAGNSWKNSVRHCLSLDTQFYKEARSSMQPGKGCFWRVSLDTPRGLKRVRKRGKKLTKRDIAEARERSHRPVSFKLTTPGFPDYATTIPVPSTPPPPPVPQAGWTPYFPSAATKSAPASPPVRHYTEVTCREREIPSTPNTPSTNPYKLSSASHWDENDQMDSGAE